MKKIYVRREWKNIVFSKVKVCISKALVDSYISPDEFERRWILNHDDTKKAIKIPDNR